MLILPVFADCRVSVQLFKVAQLLFRTRLLTFSVVTQRKFTKPSTIFSNNAIRDYQRFSLSIYFIYKLNQELESLGRKFLLKLNHVI